MDLWGCVRSSWRRVRCSTHFQKDSNLPTTCIVSRLHCCCLHFMLHACLAMARLCTLHWLLFGTWLDNLSPIEYCGLVMQPTVISPSATDMQGDGNMYETSCLHTLQCVHCAPYSYFPFLQKLGILLSFRTGPLRVYQLCHAWLNPWQACCFCRLTVKRTEVPSRTHS